MALPLRPLQSDTLRFSLIQGSTARVCYPALSGGTAPGLSLEPGEDPTGKGAFYYRIKFGQKLVFTGTDYAFLLGIEQSTNRCQAIGVLLETRSNVYESFLHEEQFIFTCNEVEWDYDAGTATVTPVTDDAYRELLENWETEINLLDCPASRSAVTAQLKVLAQGTSIEFRRIDKFDDQGDYVGKDGWAVFYTNGSVAYNNPFGSPTGYVESRDMVVFRYIKRAVPFVAVNGSSPVRYVKIDMSGAGYEALLSTQNDNVTPPTVDYVKTPDIQSFSAPKITGVGAFGQTKEYTFGAAGHYQTYLSVPCGDLPSDHGYFDADYVRVTGPDGGYPGGGPSGLGMGGANNAGGPSGFGGACLNARITTSTDNYRSLYWRFGSFTFTRGFPLLEGLRYLLSQTMAPTSRASIVPLLASQLSTFFTASTNPATGATGAANEVPRLLLSAASDVKRYGASEPADRLLVSLKTVLTDLALMYDVGWFIDPATGWFRIEHRVYREGALAAGSPWDLRAEPNAQLPSSYAYRTGKLPRYEELTLVGSSTENVPLNLYFGKASIDYGPNCTITREGQNRTTQSTTRLFGDITAAVLSGAEVPDTALAVLAPDIDGRLTLGNKQVAASELLRRYHTYGAATYAATVATLPLLVQSVRSIREQAPQSVYRCTLRGLGPATRLTTRLGAGGEIGKASIDLQAGVLTLTPWLPLPIYTATPPTLHARDFSDEFTPPFT